METQQTTVAISKDTWKIINERRKVGQTMEDVIKEYIGGNEQDEVR